MTITLFKKLMWELRTAWMKQYIYKWPKGSNFGVYFYDRSVDTCRNNIRYFIQEEIRGWFRVWDKYGTVHSEVPILNHLNCNVLRSVENFMIMYNHG